MKKIMKQMGILTLSLMVMFCQFTVVGAEQVRETVVFEDPFDGETLSSIWSVSKIGGAVLDNGVLKLPDVQAGGQISAKTGKYACKKGFRRALPAAGKYAR